MPLSENVLVIESLSVKPEEKSNGMMVLKSRLNAKIKFLCRVKGNCFRTHIIVAENEGYSQNDAIKKVIQDFIDGNVITDVQYHNAENLSLAHNKINHVDVQLQEPFKSLFKQLFDMSAWEIPKKELPRG